MQSFVFRLLSLLLRFGCPLAVLHFSTQYLLGEYYLFITFITLLVFLFSLEISITFSAKYLQNRKEKAKRLLFNEMVMTQVVLALLLSSPVIAIYGYAHSLGLCLSLLLISYVVSEACVNEAGRFFWNIGFASHASIRDFARAFGFSFAMIAAVIFDNAIVTFTSITTLLLLNIVILFVEVKKYGCIRKFSNLNFKSIGYTQRFSRLLSVIKTSKPQVIHLQILSLLPFLERSLLEKSAGMALVGSYSLQYSMVQAGASLILLPKVAEVRRIFLSAKTTSQLMFAHKTSCKFLMQVLMYSGGAAVATYFVLPVLVNILAKDVAVNITTISIVFLSASAATFAAAVSPLYATQDRIFVANALTLISMFPVALLWLSGYLNFYLTSELALCTIGLTASLLILTRLAHLSQTKTRRLNEKRI